MPFIVDFTFVHLVTGNYKHTAAPAKKAVSKGYYILMEIAKDKVVPQGTTDSEMVVGLQQLSFHSQLGYNL